MDRPHSSYGTVPVGRTATLIISANPWRKEIILANASDTATAYIGQDEDVTTANGLPFYPNQTRGHARGFGTYLGPIWGIADGNTTIRFWETC